MTGKHLRRHGYLPGTQAAAYHRQDVTVLSLTPGPALIIHVRNGFEAYAHPQFRRFEKQFLHHLAGILLVYPNQNTQRQRAVDIGLADVQNLRIVTGQDAHDGGREPHLVLSGNPN